MKLILIVAAAASLAAAHPFEQKPRWFLPAFSDTVAEPEMAAIFKAACDGVVEGNSCDACPGGERSREASWSIRSVRTGHFLSRTSTDVILTIDGCNLPAANGAAGMLLTKRDGEWTNLDYVIALETDHCRKLRFASGHDLLVCEQQSGSTSFFERSLVSVFAENDAFRIRGLFTAGDTTLHCSPDFDAQMAVIRDVQIRKTADNHSEILLTAVFGRMKMTERRVAQCEAAWEDYIQKTSAPKKNPAPLPDPPALKTYTIRYTFDGRRFQPSADSEAALRLFQWER